MRVRLAPAVPHPWLAVLVCLTISLAPPKPTSAQSSARAANTSRSSAPPHSHAEPPAADQEQVLSYWTSETGWHTELQLRNNAVGRNLTVTPVLRLADGAETSLAAVTINPQEVASVDIDAAIAAAKAPQLIGTYGSLALRYRSPVSGVLFSSAMIHETGHPVAFHIDASGELPDRDAGSREGIWWLPKDTTKDYLILTNQGGKVLPVTVSLYDASGRENKQKDLLGPHETTRLSIRKLLQNSGLAGSFGGIKVSTTAHAGSLDSLHFLFDETAGFAAILKMFDYDPNTKLEERDYARTGTWTLRAPMLALANPDPSLAFPPGTILHPQLFVRNTTGKPVDAALRFNWRMGPATGKAPGPKLHLSPWETRRIDVSALQDGTVLPKQANWTSVILTTNTLPDEIMAVAASYDETLKYGAQTPFSDQLSAKWEGSRWEYDPYHSSIITAGNGGTQPTQAGFTIFYNQGTERYELEQTLQPDEQMWIDVGKLIREHVPDKNGRTLPADLTSGSYEFNDLTDKFIGTLFEGKVIYDKTYGHVAYGCGGCCGYTQTQLWYNPLGIPFQGTAPTGVDGYTTCSATWEDVSGPFQGHWSTLNSSIATVNYYATHTGQGIGSTTSSTSGQLEHNSPRTCPILNFGPTGGDNAGPYQVEPISTNVQGPASCPTGQQGWSRTVQNQLQYKNGSGYRIAGITMADTISIGSTNQLGISSSQTGSFPTDSNGSWPDTYFVCSSACPTSAETDALQTWTFNNLGLTHSNLLVYKCTSITIDGF